MQVGEALQGAPFKKARLENGASLKKAEEVEKKETALLKKRKEAESEMQAVLIAWKRAKKEAARISVITNFPEH